MNVNVGNLGNWSLNGTFSGSTCSVSGTYFHDLDKTAGTFALTSNNASNC